MIDGLAVRLDNFEDRHPRLSKFARRWGPLMLFAAVLLLVWFGSYNNRRDNRDSQLQSCERSLFSSSDSIQGDRRQASFFGSAATVRRATWAKDSGHAIDDTAALLADARAQDPNAVAVLEYTNDQDEANASAERRASRLLGADLNVLSQLTPQDKPTTAARAEAEAACQVAVPPVGYF